MSKVNYRYELILQDVPEETDKTVKSYQLNIHSLLQEGWTMPLMMNWEDVEALHLYLSNKIRNHNSQDAYIALPP